MAYHQQLGMHFTFSDLTEIGQKPHFYFLQVNLFVSYEEL